MYDYNLLLELLKTKELACTDPNGKCFPPSHTAYIAVSEKMRENGSHITPKHIYTILNTNRRGIYKSVLETLGIVPSNTNHSNVETSNSIFEILPQHEGQGLRLIVPENKWKQIKPVVKIYNKRRYLKLHPGKWSGVISYKLWEQYKIPCAFTFKNATVYSSNNAKCYVTFYATCRECKAKLKGKMYQKPAAAHDAIFECTLHGFDNKTQHLKKRQLRGSLRRDIAGHLVDANKHATIWRTEEAKTIMTFGDAIPPTLYSSEVLRKAKQNERTNRLGIHSDNAILNLQTLKYTTHTGSIQNIGFDPFYVMYWSTEQLTMYKMINKEKDAYFTVDATGSIAKEIMLPNNSKSAHLFLYQCVIVPKNKRGIPVFQFISTKQDAALLTYFLLEIRRAGATVPSVTIIDNSRAMLVALARAFADCADLTHYLQCCYDIVIKGKEINLPSSYLRLDVSHMIKSVSKWECLRHAARKVRQFYLRCVAQIYKMDSLQDISSLLFSIFVVAASEDIGCVESNPVPAEICLQTINDCIKGVQIEEPDSSEEKLEVLENVGLDSEVNALSWKEWGNEMVAKANCFAEQSAKGDTVNAFYNPDAAKQIKLLIHILPLWTGIMRRFFGNCSEIATSSSVESLFAEYKNRVFNGNIPMRIDKFVITHLNYLDGRMRLDFAENASPIQQATKSTPEQNQEHSRNLDFEGNKLSSSSIQCFSDSDVLMKSDNSYTNCEEKEHSTDFPDILIPKLLRSDADSITNSLNCKENWMGRANEDTTMLKSKSYLTKCPEWNSVASEATVFIPVMQNGNLCKPIKIKGQTITIRNTCAFDSLLHIMLHMIGLSTTYKNYVKSKKNCLLRLAQKILITGKITQCDYSERGSILLTVPFFKQSKYSSNFSSLDTICNAAHLAEHLFSSLPSLERSKICQPCNYYKKITFPLINIKIDILLFKGLQYVQEAINALTTLRQNCFKCKKPCEVIESYGPHIIIDTSILTDPNYLKEKKLESKNYNLQSIERNISLGKKNYHLSGLVNYKSNMQHYTSIILTNTTWYEYDDLKRKRVEVSSTKFMVVPHVLIYVEV